MFRGLKAMEIPMQVLLPQSASTGIFKQILTIPAKTS